MVAKFVKLIIALNFRGLSFLKKLQRMTNIQKNHVDNPLLVPGLNPAPDEVLTKITEAMDELTRHDSLMDQLKASTQKLDAMEVDLESTFVDKWAKQTQNATGMNSEKAKLLGYGIKGENPPEPPTLDNVPVIGKIDNNTHGQHILSILNFMTGKVALPTGISRIDIYGQTGGTQPVDLAALMANGGGYLGEATKGKFVNTFGSQNLGTLEYYFAVYIDKKTKKPFTVSKVASAIIT